MSELYVLDASAVICLIDEEKGAEVVDRLVANALISAVNLAEVVVGEVHPASNAKLGQYRTLSKLTLESC